MKVIAINGSARKNGNTEILLNTVLEVLEQNEIETELVQLYNKNIFPCKACFACEGKKQCAFRNDDFNEIFNKMKEADVIILGSPVYAANISSRMQALLERSSVIADMNPGLFTHKIGTSVISSRRGGSLNAIDTLNHFFLNNEMFVVGSTYWNIAYGKLPGDVLDDDDEGIASMKNLGENISYLINCISRN